jgi:hypothetical protein
MHRTISAGLLGAATALSLALASPLTAQATYYACREPTVGAIYMVADAAAACLAAAHVKFSWSEGGSVADGSITTVKLADGAVTSAKIADGTIVGADIAANAVGSSQIANGAVTAAKLAAGAVVGWKAKVFNLLALVAGQQNLDTIVLNAPAAGQVLLRAGGYCNVTPASGVYWYSAGWGLTAVESPSQANGGVFTSNSAASTATNYQVPYTAMRIVNVSAGTNTFYMNFNLIAGTSATCAGGLSAIYTPAQLS